MKQGCGMCAKSIPDSRAVLTAIGHREKNGTYNYCTPSCIQ